MLKKTMTFKDYDGNEVTQDFYFNLSRAEVLELELSTDKVVGLETTIKRLQEERDGGKIIELFKKMIRMSIGKKSADGIRFIKSDEIADEFIQTEAYSDLVIELCTEEGKGAEFFKAITPDYEGKNDTPSLEVVK